ncbi:hypothetical protein D9615_004406 [Tricholomella constricta]|uniref:Uncharacterized protein n=1 Tax=Tricholomella constricta TaxID=117010 RepID=A0A8H5M5P1_9AGAR|nr:hypothetical protein D9615_004406 [Tricholomella constricta]
MSSSSPPEDATAGPSTSEQPTTGPYDVTERDHLERAPESSLGWLPATDQPPGTDGGAAPNSSVVKSPSPTQDMVNAPALRRSASRRSLFTNTEGQPIEGPTFITGAATSGPYATAQADEELTSRAATADASLTPKERSRIAKSEGMLGIQLVVHSADPVVVSVARDGKRLSKIIKDEGRAEKEALNVAINELAGFQRIQAASVKNEAKANAARAKVHAEFQKQESLFLAARAKFEAAQARLTSEDEAVEVVRNAARDATEKLQEKSQEVDSLRVMYGVDERERAARLAAIAGKPERSGSSCVIT